MLKLKKSPLVKYIYYQYLQRWLSKIISDEKSVAKKYLKVNNRKLNLSNPQKYYDKIQFLKLRWKDPFAEKCADKYEARKIVGKIVGEAYLNEILFETETCEKINIENLPDKFVIKCTHASGYNIICYDKYQMDWEAEFKKLKYWMKINYYYVNREWVYKNIKPRIIIEKFIEDARGKSARDYKFYCFNGEPKLIHVDIDRYEEHMQNFYDLDFNFIDTQISYKNDKDIQIQRPKKLEEMLEICRKLSAPFPHVRVDLYYHNEQIIFGEMTFFHRNGMGIFMDEKLEIEMGDWLCLDQIDSSGLYKYEERQV